MITYTHDILVTKSKQFLIQLIEQLQSEVEHAAYALEVCIHVWRSCETELQNKTEGFATYLKDLHYALNSPKFENASALIAVRDRIHSCIESSDITKDDLQKNLVDIAELVDDALEVINEYNNG